MPAMGKGTIMFGHGVRVTSSSNNIERVSADCAVEALAWMLGVQFRKDYGVVSAKGGLAYKLDVPLFKNGEREQLLQPPVLRIEGTTSSVTHSWRGTASGLSERSTKR